MEYSELYNEKSIGKPIKVKMGYKKDNPTEPVYIRGRYYGTGYDGESKPGDEDYTAYITLVTPGGSLINGNSIHFQYIDNEEDMAILRQFEEMEKEPYAPYLFGLDGEYVKTYDYLKEPLTTKYYKPSWYDKEGYLDIDMKVFGEGLSCLFTYNLDYPCFYSEIFYEYEGKTRAELNYHNVHDSRYLSVIAPKQYAKTVRREFNDSRAYRPRTEYDTMFKQKPLRLIDEAYLLSFSTVKKDKIRLGEIVNGEFVPAYISPIKDASNKDEVEYVDPGFSFIQEFMTVIMNYKLKNRKPNITMEDMYIILGQYGIERRAYLESLARVLKNAHDKAMTTLAETNSVGMTLTKKSE